MLITDLKARLSNVKTVLHTHISFWEKKKSQYYKKSNLDTDEINMYYSSHKKFVISSEINAHCRIQPFITSHRYCEVHNRSTVRLRIKDLKSCKYSEVNQITF